MFAKRACERCDGQQFRVIDGGGAITGWAPAPRSNDHWFCPTCDWGRRDNSGDRAERLI